MSTRNLLALLGCGAACYREYLLGNIANDFDILLINDEPPSWQSKYIKAFCLIPAFAVPDIRKALQEGGFDNQIGGVLCWDERYVIHAAELAEAFGLPSLSSDGALNCRDKSRTRHILRQAGLRQPQSQFCETARQALAFADAREYPLIAKPKGMGSSNGVTLVSDARQLETVFEATKALSMISVMPQFRGGVLMEEVIPGPEISIDSVTINGSCTPLFLARKYTSFAPHFEETGHDVLAEDARPFSPELIELLAKSHAALGIESGITHTEIKLTPDGPVIVEVNGRIGGDLIPFLAEKVLGVNIARIAAHVAMGAPPPLAAELRSNAAAIRFRYPDEADLTVSQVTTPPRHFDDAYDCISHAIAEPGYRVGLPPDVFAGRVGYAAAWGAELTRCQEEAERAAGLIEYS